MISDFKRRIRTTRRAWHLFRIMWGHRRDQQSVEFILAKAHYNRFLMLNIHYLDNGQHSDDPVTMQGVGRFLEDRQS